MFPFTDYDVVEITNLPNLGEQKKLDAFESVFWNYALGVNFYPSLSEILKPEIVYELDFKDYVIGAINSAFNCQNYKRSSIAYRDMLTALNNPCILKELKLISDKDYMEVVQNFSFESFILNQKYRQLSFWNIENEQIGFIKHTYSEDIVDRCKGIGKSLTTLTFSEIENLLRDSFKFSKGLINLGIMYNNVLKNKQTCSKLLSQIDLDGVLRDAIYIANTDTSDVHDSEYYRVVYNIFLFICVCNDVVVSFK